MKADDDFEAAPQRYAALLPVLRDVARTYGYALAVHGSQRRDLDVVAVPWVERACSAATLVEALRLAVGGAIIYGRDVLAGDHAQRNPTQKPHGRQAWAIHVGGRLYIDVSVMPLSSGLPATEAEISRLRGALAEAESRVRVFHLSQGVAWRYYRRTRTERDHARTLRRRAAQRALGLRGRLQAAVEECRRRKGLEQDVAHWRERAEDAEAAVRPMRSVLGALVTAYVAGDDVSGHMMAASNVLVQPAPGATLLAFAHRAADLVCWLHEAMPFDFNDAPHHREAWAALQAWEAGKELPRD